MSLQSRLSALITAIGTDIKTLQTQVAALGGTPDQHNASTAIQTGFATDTYLAGSMVSIPTGKIKAGTKYRCKFNVVKTNAGLAGPVITARVGTAGAIGDTARAATTFAAQTAVVDEGEIEVELVFRAAGASAIIQALSRLTHRLATTGLNVTASNTFILNTGAAFDVTGANLKIGLSVNAGTNAAWSVSLVRAELTNLAA